mgnify:CR=1 FL=1
MALNAERAEEERRGIIRWLRPEFQNPRGRRKREAAAKGRERNEGKGNRTAHKSRRPWAKDLPAQTAAVRERIPTNPTETWTLDRTAKAFKGAKRTQVNPSSTPSPRSGWW